MCKSTHKLGLSQILSPLADSLLFSFCAFLAGGSVCLKNKHHSWQKKDLGSAAFHPRKKVKWGPFSTPLVCWNFDGSNFSRLEKRHREQINWLLFTPRFNERFQKVSRRETASWNLAHKASTVAKSPVHTVTYRRRNLVFPWNCLKNWLWLFLGGKGAGPQGPPGSARGIQDQFQFGAPLGSNLRYPCLYRSSNMIESKRKKKKKDNG